MKALLMKEYGNMIYTDVPMPECQDYDVLVRIMACAICGSDVHGWDGSSGRRIPPIIMGHEASGVVARVGSRVQKVKIGDRVSFDSMVFCGECERCRKGETNLCENLNVLGVTFGGENRAGAYAEYTVVPEHIVYPMPDGVSFVDASNAEPLSVAYHAVRRFPIQPDDSVLVIGAGIIGSLVIKVLKRMGVQRIVAVDINPGKLQTALNMGATEAVLSNLPDCGDRLRALARKGFDYAYDAIGLNETVNRCINHLRDGGGLGLVGNVHKDISLPLQQVVTREIRISGSYASAREYDACLDMIAGGQIAVADMISAVAPMSQGNAWFQRLHNNEPGLLKVVLVPDSVLEASANG